MSLIAELKRRRVFRVAGAYLVAAWVVLQVADVVFPALKLPPWTLTFLVVLVILGFPIALILGWAFDITPGGIERTPSVPATLRFPTRAALVGTLLVTTGILSFVFVRRRAVAARLDPNAVVVLPFRVVGDAKLANMREGMVDLLSTKLDGNGGARAIDSRTTLAAWRREVENEKDDLAPIEAMHLARDLGAANVLLGDIVGTGANTIAVSAKVYSAVSGGLVSSVEDTTSSDNVLKLVDRLAAKLLATEAGQTDRMEALLSSSLPAVQHYLDGQRLYRRGLHYDAAKAYEDALKIDSTFGLAALGQALALDWAGTSAGNVNRANQLAFTYRERLPARDRDYVIARLGPEFPKPRPAKATISSWESMAAKYPDRAETWYELGDRIFHLGRLVGMKDNTDRAMRAWSRAIELDSAFTAPLEHHMEIYAARNDTAGVRRTYEQLTRFRSSDRMREYAWYYALTMNDVAMRKKLLHEAAKWERSDIYDVITAVTTNGLPFADIDSLFGILKQTASTAAQRTSTSYSLLHNSLNRGRPTGAHSARALADGVRPEILAQVDLVTAILYEEMRAERAEPAAATLRTVPSLTMGQCWLGIWDAVSGRSADEGVSRLQDALQRDTVPRPGGQVCLHVIPALASAGTDPARARAHADRADSLLLNGPVLAAQAHFTHSLLLSQVYERIGDLNKARDVASRIGYAADLGRAPLLLQYARLAARTGQRDEAIEAYRQYLNMRDNPEPGAAKQITDKARAELAALTSR